MESRCKWRQMVAKSARYSVVEIHRRALRLNMFVCETVEMCDVDLIRNCYQTLQEFQVLHCFLDSFCIGWTSYQPIVIFHVVSQFASSNRP
jgi:hypothetical protein